MPRFISNDIAKTPQPIEEQGGLEKFRPYAALRDDWLADLGRELARRFGPSDKQA